MASTSFMTVGKWAIYAVKAQPPSLWTEMNNVFSRVRGKIQNVKRVGHPTIRTEYRRREGASDHQEVGHSASPRQSHERISCAGTEHLNGNLSH
jgi:hypothetical protein